MLVTVALLFGLLAPRAVYATNNIDQPELGSQVEGSAEVLREKEQTRRSLAAPSLLMRRTPLMQTMQGNPRIVAAADLTNKQNGPLDNEDLHDSSAEDPPISIDRYGRTVVNINDGWSFTSNDASSDGWGFPDGRSSGVVNLPHSGNTSIPRGRIFRSSTRRRQHTARPLTYQSFRMQA